jgi:glyceraldehyde 3-phosphate dehydrogenase
MAALDGNYGANSGLHTDCGRRALAYVEHAPLPVHVSERKRGRDVYTRGGQRLGRTGRSFLRSAYARRADIEVVAVNDVADAGTLAHLLKYDSVAGRFPGRVEVRPGTIAIDDHEIRVTAETDPTNLAWGDVDVDVVIESTGYLRTRAAAARHLDAGARKVIISAPAKGDEPPDATVVLGVNFD